MDWYQHIMKHHIVISIIIWKSYHIIDLVLPCYQMISSICYEKLHYTNLWYSTIWRIIVIIHSIPMILSISTIICTFSINRFLFVFHPLIWIVTMIIRYDMICDCIITNYQILSPLLISNIHSSILTIQCVLDSFPHHTIWPNWYSLS